MRKIALRGLIGRKRETLLLWTVVVLAFLFLALPTTLITSIQATDAAQRISTYGAWQIMASGISEEDARSFASRSGESAVLPLLPVSGTNFFDGNNTCALTTYTPELEQLGRLQLREGRWPQEKNEVTLEYARLAALDMKVGDTVTLQCQLELPMTRDHLVDKEEAYTAALEESTSAVREITTEFFLHGDWELTRYIEGQLYDQEFLRVGEDYMAIWNNWFNFHGFFDELCFMSFWYNYYEPLAFLFATDENLEGRAIPLDQLTEEEFSTALEYFLANEWPETIEREKRVTDLLGVDDMPVRVEFVDSAETANPMSLTLLCEFTICGVADTYTDRWDSGRLDLPGGFVSEECYRMFQKGQDAALEKYPYFIPHEYDNMVLFGGIEDAPAFWRELRSPYNQAVLDQSGFTAPVSQCYTSGGTKTASGSVVNFDSILYQITFPLTLADLHQPLMEETREVTAWLELEDTVDNSWWYCRGHLLDSRDGEPYYTVQGSMSQLEGGNGMFTISGESNKFGFESLKYRGDLDASTVCFDLDGTRYSIPFPEFASGDFTAGGLGPIVPGKTVWANGLEEPSGFAGLRLNRYAYPSSTESTGNLLLLVMGVLFVTTAGAVFQICFTQIRRRLRRVVLLKSLGSTTGQIAKLMAWEFLYFWITAMPLGTALGLLASWAAAELLGGAQGRAVALSIRPEALLLALAAGTAALALGMAVPAAMAVGVPLTGRTVRKKPLPPPKREVRQDFLHVTLRGLSAKKGRVAGTFSLCVFMMLIAGLCLFLGFRMAGEYRDTVVREGKPDYHLRSPYAMSQRQREGYLAELEELGVCGETVSYFAGGGIELNASLWKDSPLLTAAAGEAETCQITLHTFPSSDPVFSRLQSAATVGTLDPEAFDRGEQVLLMIPLYQDTGGGSEAALRTANGWERLAASGIATSYYAEYDGVYSRDTAIQAGGQLPMQVTYQSIVNDQWISSVKEAAPTVGAILYYFPEEGIWPFSSGEGWQVAGSPALLSQLKPMACMTLTQEAARAQYLRQSALEQLSGSYGVTDFYINCREDVSLEQADTALLVFARNHYMEFEIYHESSEKLLRDAVNNILLVCLLGLTALLLALIIFYNTLASDLEQERCRIGILQALGVSNRLLARRQLILGSAAAGTALVLSNLLLWGGVTAFAGMSGSVLGNLLWGYPAVGHGVLCLFLCVVITALFLAPMGRLRRFLPVENIRTKK